MKLFRVLGTWSYGVLVALDQLGNALFYGFADETASSRLGRRIKRLRGKDPLSNTICAGLDAIDPDHCSSSIEETPTGETDAHHLGRVIREIPRDPATRLHKVPKAVLGAALALLIAG